MKINNVEIDFDFTDADNIEAVTKGLEELKARADEYKKNPKVANLPEVIREECGAVFNFFDTVFGEGTSKKIFGDRCSLITCVKAVSELAEYKRTQDKEMADMLGKYSPQRANRE